MYGDHLWRSILQTLHTLYLWSQSGNTKSARHSPNATKSPAGRPKELSSIAQMAKGYFIEKEAFLSVLATWIFVGLPDFTELVAQMASGLWHFWCSLIAQMAKGYFIEKEAFLSVLATWIFVGLPDFTGLVAQMASELWHFWCSLEQHL